MNTRRRVFVFSSALPSVKITGTGTGTGSGGRNYITINGTNYTTARTLSVEVGTTITVTVQRNTSWLTLYDCAISIDGTVDKLTTRGGTLTKTYAVTSKGCKVVFGTGTDGGAGSYGKYVMITTNR